MTENNDVDSTRRSPGLEDDVEVPEDDVELPQEDATLPEDVGGAPEGGTGEGGRKKKRLKRQEGEEDEEEPRSREDEMWDHVAPAADSEEDQEGPMTHEDVAFIDDEGVAADTRYASDNEGSVGDAPQAEEGEPEDDDDIDSLFKKKKKKRADISQEDLEMFFENKVTAFMRAPVLDAEQNRKKQPAINKLKMLPELKKQLLTTHLRAGYLERGILGVLKQWLEPMPDQSLPSLPVRTGILEILGKLQLDVGQTDEREQLVESSLGKSRPLFQKSTRYEDLREQGKEHVPPPRRPGPVAPREASKESKDVDLELEAKSSDPKQGEKGYRVHAAVPRPMVLDFKHRPVSKVTAEQAQQRRPVKEGRRYEMLKKMQKMGGGKSKNLKAEKLSVEGRNLTKYI